MWIGPSDISNFLRFNNNRSNVIYWDWRFILGLTWRLWEFWFEQENFKAAVGCASGEGTSFAKFILLLCSFLSLLPLVFPTLTWIWDCSCSPLTQEKCGHAKSHLLLPAPLSCSCPGDPLVCLERQKDEREERREECNKKNYYCGVMVKLNFISLGFYKGWCLVHEEGLHFASPPGHAGWGAEISQDFWSLFSNFKACNPAGKMEMELLTRENAVLGNHKRSQPQTRELERVALLEPLRNIIQVVSSGRRSARVCLWPSTATQSDGSEFGFWESRTQADHTKSQDWGFNKDQI